MSETPHTHEHSHGDVSHEHTHVAHDHTHARTTTSRAPGLRPAHEHVPRGPRPRTKHAH